MTSPKSGPGAATGFTAITGSKFWAVRATRYTLAGIIAAVMNNIVIDLGDLLGASYAVGTIVAFLVVTPIAYLLQTKFTFQQPRSWTAFARFAVGVATAFPAFLLCMALLCDGLGAPVAIAAPIATIVLYFWNFVWAHWALHFRAR